MTTNIHIKNRRDQSAFTLIEIVLVLAIIALLLGAAVFQLTGVHIGAQTGRVHQDLTTFRSALTVYRMNSGNFPTSEQGLKALTEKPTGNGRTSKNWEQSLRKEQLDPWQNPYGYRFPPTKNKTDPDIWSFGIDGIDGTDDDICNWED